MRALKSFLCLLSMLMLSGCWSQINFDQLTVVSAIGLDAAEDDQVRVTLQLANPTLPIAASGGGQQRRPYANYDATGITIHAAIQQIQHQAKKSLFFPQTKIVLIGEKLARRGLDDLLDYFWRETDQNLNSWVLVSRQSAHKTLEEAKELEPVPSQEWKKYLAGTWKRPLHPDVEIYQFLPRLNQVGFQAMSPGIFRSSSAGQDGVMEIGGTAVFRNDRMVGWLTGDESQIVNWLTRGSSRGSFQTDIEHEEAVNFSLTSIRAKIVPVVRDGRLAMRLKLTGVAEVLTTTMPLDFSQAQPMLRQVLNRQVERAVSKTMDKLFVTYGSDVIGFGETLHRRMPSEWKKRKASWDSDLKKVDVEIAVSFRIKRAGLLR
ncbi:Ger(x)C family spore germination protein [Cohnella boryungensis]|uniref:Ger(X)C family spore germination protein n=1 Tax=Cohnella boryungensis TaxID=768479 RepID=A0ABV8S944_9BACL